MTILKVKDMHCQNCVNRITKALKAANIIFSVSLEDKTVTIDDDVFVETAISILDDTGFEAAK